jgi:short-subunit dehydrogenase
MKSIFITGATSGIGLALAKLYAKQGWRVGVMGRDGTKISDWLKSEKNVEFFEVDVTNREDVKKAVANFSSRTGIDIIVANAGIAYKHKSKMPDFDYSIKIVHVNLLGVMYTVEAALPFMVKQNSGHIVLVSSIAGYNGLPGVSIYGATKAAVTSMGESLALDMKKFNIHTTVICPGFINTPLTQVNPHPMPFMISAELAAQKIQYAIVKKKPLYCFPFVFTTIVRFLGILPRCIYRYLISLKMFNYSKD